VTRGRRTSICFLVLAVASSALALFFGVYGALLVYTALTFSGEGSLGHVGMYVAAFLFPLLSLFFGGAAWLAWGRSGRPRRARRP